MKKISLFPLKKNGKRQETEVKLALIGKGEYRLKDEYKYLELSEDLYWRKSARERQCLGSKLKYFFYQL